MTQTPAGKNTALAEFGAWCEALLRQAGQLHESLGSEQKIWFWIASVAAVVAACTVVFLLLRTIIRWLNNALASPAGWRPVRFYMMMWAGTGIWAMIYALVWRSEGSPGWSVLFAAGALAVAGLVWFLVHHLGPAKAAGAVAVNSGFGCVVSPVVIQLGLIAIFIVVLIVGFLLFAGPTPRPVYVINR